MRRIKSAPANLCNMCHRKIQSLKNSEQKTVIINDNNTVKITEIKSKRQVLSTSSNIITDAINDSNTLSFEENFVVAFILSYIFENIIKKDKFKNLEAFIIQNGVRFLVSYLIHQHVVIDLVQGIYLH
jgi:hypothetical protein